jgi:MoxR-like ATPase
VEGRCALQVFTRTNLLNEVAREVHGRLPATISQHADAMLPQLAKQAVDAAAPNLVEVRASVENGVLATVEGGLPALVRRAADELLPRLAEEAVGAAAPDPAGLRAELLAAAGAEVTEVVRRETGAALEVVVLQGTERVQAAVGTTVDGAVAEASERMVADVARRAGEQAGRDADQLRDRMIAEVSARLRELLDESLATAAPHAVRDATDEMRDVFRELVRHRADELLPELARGAVERILPDLEELRELVTKDVQASASEAVAAQMQVVAPNILQKLTTGATRELNVTVERQEKQLAGTIQTAVDEAVARKVAEFAPTVVEVTLPARKKVRLDGDAHAVLPELLTALHARCHVLLVGPAGTGKSMLAKHAAQALDLPFQALSLGPTTPMSKVFGYFDAHGNYHDTPFRKAFESGGVMLLDELDNGHPGLLAELNQALALGTCAFADGMVDAHDDFRLVATGNTYGTGADRQYVGRQTLDSATLDRFVVIDVPIDEDLEERIALRHAPSAKEQARELLEDIRDLRDLIREKNLPIILSPRASIDGAKLLEAGATLDQVFRWRIVRGLSSAHRKALDLD